MTTSTDISRLLERASEASAEFLTANLPRAGSEDWWSRRVLQFLSPAQLDAVERRGITDLSELDLAALLQTLDNNWRSLDEVCVFPPGTLNYVKEMRAVRNRWSHRSAMPYEAPDDIYRDLDTLERFLAVIGATDELVSTVRDERLAMLVQVLEHHAVEVPELLSPSTDAESDLPAQETSNDPSCPVCESQMVLRTARTGPHAGNQFWGCTEWSVNGCNGIINIPKAQDPDSEPPPNCPNCQSHMVLRTARSGPYAGNQFWGCSEWGITGCSGLRNIQESRTFDPVPSEADNLPF